MMKKSKNCIPTAMKKMIFSSLIQSSLGYCISIYGGASKSVIEPLVKIQKRAIRLVNESHYSKHCDPMFAAIGCLKFHDLYKMECARVAVKYFYDNLPNGNMDCLLERRSAYQTRETTGGKNLKVPPASSKQMCCTNVPKIWNKEVPSDFKVCQETTFIGVYKEHFLQQYRSYICSVPNCYSCRNSRNL